MRAIIFCGVLLLLGQQALVTGHPLSRTYSANDLAKLKTLLEQFEETLGGEEPGETLLDYENMRPEPDQEPPSVEWERDRAPQVPVEVRAPEDSYRVQKNRLQDLLVSARSKSLSGCFGTKLDRIGSSSGLGCGPKRG